MIQGQVKMKTLIASQKISGWVDVEWDNGNKNSYRYGKDSALDVKVRQISLCQSA